MDSVARAKTFVALYHAETWDHVKTREPMLPLYLSRSEYGRPHLVSIRAARTRSSLRPSCFAMTSTTVSRDFTFSCSLSDGGFGNYDGGSFP